MIEWCVELAFRVYAIESIVARLVEENHSGSAFDIAELRRRLAALQIRIPRIVHRVREIDADGNISRSLARGA